MTSIIPYLPDPIVAQSNYVDWSKREHWLRQMLQRARADLWRCLTDNDEKKRLETRKVELEWCRAEAEDRVVYFRSVLHAQGIQAI